MRSAPDLVFGSCGEENPERFRLCGSCRSALQFPQNEEQRKMVTLLFADVIGSTALAEALDAETVQSVMTTYFETTRSA